MPVMPEGALRTAGAHDPTDGGTGDGALRLSASGRGEGRPMVELAARGLVGDRQRNGPSEMTPARGSS
jgi:hypothetical protein